MTLLPANRTKRRDNEIQILVDLGLTSLQAKVYFALLNTGCSSAKTTSKVSEVCRQDIYRILNELIEMGLVAKSLDSPTKYDPVQLEDGLNILFQRKNNSIIDMHRKASILLKKFAGKKRQRNLTGEPRIELLVYNVTSDFAGTILLDTARTNIKSITPWELLNRIFFAHVERRKNALKRGVKFQILTNIVEGESLLKPYKAFITNSLFELKHVPQIASSFSIVDDKTVYIGTTRENYGAGKVLISDNAAIVKIFCEYFKMIWEKATEIPAAKLFEKG
jgi:sugar-specific transcriptional regulator TrmB